MERFFAELDTAFTETLEVDGCKIRRSVEPVLLAPLVEAAIDDIGIEPSLINDFGPYSALTETGTLDLQTIVDFEWTGGGPPSSDAQIDMMKHGATAYICLGPGGDLDWDWMAIAALEPGTDPSALDAFLKDYLSSNGAAYGAEIFGSLPTEIRTKPDLITRDGIRAAVKAWLTWAETFDDDVWDRLASSLESIASDKSTGTDREQLLDAYVDAAWSPMT